MEDGNGGSGDSEHIGTDRFLFPKGLRFISTAVQGRAHVLPMALGYTFCSSMLMVGNKLALNAFPFPSLLMALQFFTSAMVVRVLAALGKLEASPLEWDKVRSFWMVPLFFEIAIFANIKLLQAASIETTIVFRTMVPLITSGADYVFMGRELPSRRSACGLITIVLSALVYARSSSGGIRVDTWMWAIVYLLVLAFEMVYVKHVLNRLPMSTWTRVYYNNAIALCFWPPFLLCDREYERVLTGLYALQRWRPASMVGLSCVLGVGISFTGFGLRNLVTATTFTVLGVMNKVLTILLSMLLFTQRASALSVLSLLACIGGGTMYQQAPPRADHDHENDEDEEAIGSKAETERLIKPAT